jgi:hypothetical protein
MHCIRYHLDFSEILGALKMKNKSFFQNIVSDVIISIPNT